MFAPVFICPNCGDVWQVSVVEEIDTTHDEIYSVPLCNKCSSPVTEKIIDGVPEWHALTPDEMDAELYWDPDESAGEGD